MTIINTDKFISRKREICLEKHYTNIMLYIYISRRISRKTKYESNGKVDGKLLGDIHNVIHWTWPLAFIPSLWIVLLQAVTVSIQRRSQLRLKTRTLSNLKDELISEATRRGLKNRVVEKRVTDESTTFSINALVLNFRFLFFSTFVRSAFFFPRRSMYLRFIDN